MRSDPVILYLHIPKTGGTTISDLLYNQLCDYNDEEIKNHVAEQDPYHPGNFLFYAGIYYFPGRDSTNGFFKDPDLTIPASVKRVFGRNDLRAVLGHFWFGVQQNLARPWTYITLLRHPVDRVLSLYHHLEKYESLTMTIDEFLERPPYREVDNDQTRRISGVEPELGKCTRWTLEQAKANLRRHFSVVGVTERFDETMILLRRKFGWTKDLLYYPKNTNPDRPSIDSIPQTTRDSILRWNELDHELYCFANGIMDEMIATQDESFHDEVRELRARKQALLGACANKSGEGDT